MANESRVFNVPQPGAATHALVVGVGAYPHLLGGNGPPIADAQGLGQLTSPPVSARALVNWLTSSFHNADRPLASVRLLASADPVAQGAMGVAPTIDAIGQAVNEWLADGNTNPENQILFYFCGHGLGANSLLALLAEDFGSNPNNEIDGAIDFVRFRNGMNRCAAQYQCYFVDACRSNADIIAYGAGAAGRWFVTQPAGTKKKQQPVFYSTQLGALAHGPSDGNPSYFTQALLKGLNGTGSTRTLNTWRVNTMRLAEALNVHMLRTRKQQIPPADDLTLFPITASPNPPVVPVYVRCKPSNAFPQVTLSCRTPAAVFYQKPMAAEEVELELVEGTYEFEAASGAYATKICNHTVQPPEYPIEIEVGS